MGLLHSIGKIVGGVGHLLFGSGSKIKYPDPKKTVMPRDDLLSSFYSIGFPTYLGYTTSDDGKTYRLDPSKLAEAKQTYLNAQQLAANKEKMLSDYLFGMLPKQDFLTSYVRPIETPFGWVPAYGLQQAELKNKAIQTGILGDLGRTVGLLSSLIADSYVRPAQAQYKTDYLDPLNVFLKEDLARYGVSASPIAVQGSTGLLGTLAAAMAKEGAKPLTTWAISNVAKPVFSAIASIF